MKITQVVLLQIKNILKIDSGNKKFYLNLNNLNPLITTNIVRPTSAIIANDKLPKPTKARTMKMNLGIVKLIV